MLATIARSVRHALQGLRAAYKRDKSFRMEVHGGFLYLLVVYLLWPLHPYEFLFLFLSWCLILIAELINTAFEQILERIHPEYHELIGKGKDIAAGAVLTAFVFAGGVILTLVLMRFGFFPGN